MKYYNGFNKNLHISKDEFVEAVNRAISVNDLCKILNKSKPSVYTYAYRYCVPLKGRYCDGVRKSDGYYHYNDNRNHRRIMEKHLNRKLLKNECVHHIDGDKMNNSISNLVILDRSVHEIAHKSLEKCALEFFKQDLIYYDFEINRYKIKGKAK